MKLTPTEIELLEWTLDQALPNISPTPAAKPWTDTPIAFLEIPPPIRCPYCGHDRPPIIIRSIDQGDGSRLRRCVCRRCGQRFRIVLEPQPPATGKADSPEWYDSSMEETDR